MNRLLVAVLAAFDALIAVAVGVAAALAPLTLLWVFGLGGGADWAALWPAAATLWQAGHLVPLQIALDADYATVVGIPAEAVSFGFSLAPLAFAVFTAVFAARSGARAARSGAGVVGVAVGTGAVAALAAGVAVTSSLAPVVSVTTWQAILFPALVFGTAAAVGALVRAWREGDDGVLDRLRDRMDLDDTGIVEAAARGLWAALAGLVALGAVLVAVAVAVSGGRVVALFEAAHVDLVGVIILGFAQLAYLPTLIVWGVAYAAGPGFAVGAGTAVSPAGTSLGVVPGVPALGLLPDGGSPWLLLLALAVVAVGAAAGWVARRRLAEADAGAGGARDGRAEPLVPRLIVLAAVAVGGALSAALLALVASGALGPERLQTVGPEPLPIALAVGAELAVGAAAVLLSPRREPSATPID